MPKSQCNHELSVVFCHLWTVLLASGLIIVWHRNLVSSTSVRTCSLICNEVLYQCDIYFVNSCHGSFSIKLPLLLTWFTIMPSYFTQSCIDSGARYTAITRELWPIFAVCKDSYVVYACGFDRNGKWELFCESKLHCKNDVAKWRRRP